MTVAEEIGRLRRVGGQETVPAESAASLACLGRTEDASRALDECLSVLPRLYPFERPYYLLAVASKALGRQDQAVELALGARRRAWADGPAFTYSADLGQAESLLNQLEVPLEPLRGLDPNEVSVPCQPELERLLR